MRKGLFALVFLFFCPLLVAQQTLNNDSVIKLVKAGLSDDLIVSTINASLGTYDISANGLIALKNASVSDKVIAVVIARNTGAITPASPTFNTASSTGLPPGIDSVGIYCKDRDGVWNEVVAEVVNFKTGGALKHLGSIGLIKGDLNGHLGGNRSRLILKTPAEFILYVPEGRSPGEYQLLKFRVNSDSREFRSLTGGIVHVTGGATRDAVDFTSKKIAPRVYAITLTALTGKGEYGFLPPLDLVSQTNLASSGKIYTFSIVE
ncbi:MAG: hypothetical protein P4K86_06380 [Terracidiphilus sp.]|nr:hypothetical protein [Terracidiphilus sp.]MDR3777297.1 hypothetical protein [Terracidiphilus sp.]